MLGWLLFSVVLIGIDANGRYFRFKDKPHMWSVGLIATSTAVWVGAWLFILYYLDRRLTTIEIVQSLIFGVAYFAALSLLGRRVARISPPHNR